MKQLTECELDELKLEWLITDKILEVVNLYNEVTTSDLQGIAQANTKEIIRLVRYKNDIKNRR